MSRSSLRETLLACFDTALAAVRPGPALAGVLDLLEPPADPPRLLAAGKAAVPMARAAAAWLGARGIRPGAGLVVAPDMEPAAGLPVLAGDHPLPGPGSAAGADAIGTFCRATPPDATVWFLLSGGATSLMAGPEAGLTVDDLRGAWDQLLRSGVDIRGMNLVRKRLSRWGGGKLATALGHARVAQFIISDVIGDRLDAIGSGPMVADTGTAADARRVVEEAGLRGRLPAAVMRRLDAMATGDIPDLPGPETPAFQRISTRLVATNRMALEAAAELGRARGCEVQIVETPLSGDAAEAGRRLAGLLAGAPRDDRTRLLVAGGETTVRLPATGGGRGGRSQELALAAAAELGAAGRQAALLSAGTDGRDGPTDAAGAVVDWETWGRIRARGLDPAALLADHASYDALDASHDLLRTGLTGTNVMDLVIGIVAPE